jgi:GxxExxY protein
LPLAYQELTNTIINAFYTVYNALGYGFLEKVYENALAHELRKRSLTVESQHKLAVYYDGIPVGEYFADLLVENSVVLELKAAEAIDDAHTAQLINYLKATKCEVGFVLNFGPDPKFERRYFSNQRKLLLQRKNQRESAKSASSAFYFVFGL